MREKLPPQLWNLHSAATTSLRSPRPPDPVNAPLHDQGTSRSPARRGREDGKQAVGSHSPECALPQVRLRGPMASIQLLSPDQSPARVDRCSPPVALQPTYQRDWVGKTPPTHRTWGGTPGDASSAGRVPPLLPGCSTGKAAGNASVPGRAGGRLLRFYRARCLEYGLKRPNSVVEAQLATGPGHGEAVEILCLNRTYLGEKGVRAVVDVLRFCPSLRVLELSGTGLSMEGGAVEALIHALPSCPLLHTVDLSLNALSDRAGELLYQIIARSGSTFEVRLDRTGISPPLIRKIHRRLLHQRRSSTSHRETSEPLAATSGEESPAASPLSCLLAHPYASVYEPFLISLSADATAMNTLPALCPEEPSHRAGPPPGRDRQLTNSTLPAFTSGRAVLNGPMNDLCTPHAASSRWAPLYAESSEDVDAARETEALERHEAEVCNHRRVPMCVATALVDLRRRLLRNAHCLQRVYDCFVLPETVEDHVSMSRAAQPSFSASESSPSCSVDALVHLELLMDNVSESQLQKVYRGSCSWKAFFRGLRLLGVHGASRDLMQAIAFASACGIVTAEHVRFGKLLNLLRPHVTLWNPQTGKEERALEIATAQVRGPTTGLRSSSFWPSWITRKVARLGSKGEASAPEGSFLLAAGVTGTSADGERHLPWESARVHAASRRSTTRSPVVPPASPPRPDGERKAARTRRSGPSSSEKTAPTLRVPRRTGGILSGLLPEDSDGLALPIPAKEIQFVMDRLYDSRGLLRCFMRAEAQTDTTPNGHASAARRLTEDVSWTAVYGRANLDGGTPSIGVPPNVSGSRPLERRLSSIISLNALPRFEMRSPRRDMRRSCHWPLVHQGPDDAQAFGPERREEVTTRTARAPAFPTTSEGLQLPPLDKHSDGSPLSSPAFTACMKLALPTLLPVVQAPQLPSTPTTKTSLEVPHLVQFETLLKGCVMIVGVERRAAVEAVLERCGLYEEGMETSAPIDYEAALLSRLHLTVEPSSIAPEEERELWGALTVAQLLALLEPL